MTHSCFQLNVNAYGNTNLPAPDRYIWAEMQVAEKSGLQKREPTETIRAILIYMISIIKGLRHGYNISLFLFPQVAF